MKSILCATDLSLRAELAVERAAALARQFGARLQLLHVVDNDQPGAIVDVEIARAHETLLAQVVTMTSDSAVEVESEVKAGVVFQTIVSTARETVADLVVMGAHRRRILKDVVVGTTIERVMRTGDRPVLMVNTASSARYESVLLALDASKASTVAASSARSLRLLDQVRLSVICAFEPLYKGSLSWAGAQESTITEYSEAWATEAKGEIRLLLRQAGLDDDSMQILTEEGPPFVVVTEAVARLRPHLLVIGTHGRGGLKRALLGSIAERVISEVECDVLVVPSQRTA